MYPKIVNSESIFIHLYVHDMIIFCACIDVVNETKCLLTSKYDMKDLGETNIILGGKIIRRDSGVMFIQEHYMEWYLKDMDALMLYL